MKLFILLSRVPYPIEKGDKLRAFHQIRCLSKHHDIVLCALSEGPVHPDALRVLGKYCSEIHILPIGKIGMFFNVIKALFTGLPFQVGYFYRCRVKRKIDAILRDARPEHIYCQLIRVAQYTRDQKIPKTLDYQDVFSMGVKRRLDSSSFWTKIILKPEYKRLLRYEADIFSDFGPKTIISGPDRELIPHPAHNSIHIIPNGVDHEFFAPAELPKKYDLVFTGNMGYPPNVDAAEFLVRQILPLVWKIKPDASLLIAGANPAPKLLALKSGLVTVSGWVDDIRPSYAASQIFIAPMRIGTGLQNKLLEAMSMKIPCITSPLANAALGAKANTEILVGSSPEEYAEHIISLLSDENQRNTIAENGHQFVKDTYDWEKSTEILNRLIINSENKQ